MPDLQMDPDFVSDDDDPASEASGGWLSRAANRLVALFEKRVQKRRSDDPGPQKRRTGALVIALVIFIGASITAALNLPPVESEVRVWLLALVPLVGVPATVLTNAAEFQVTAAVSGRGVSLPVAVRVAVMSSAANLLPIPGAFIVRSKALKDGGSTLRGAIRSTATMGVAWIGVTFLIAGAVGAVLADLGPSLGAAAFGACLTGAALLVLSRQEAVRERPVLLLAAVAVEAAGVIVNGFRFLFVLWGLGYEVGVEQAVALTVATVLASATGFFPGGLGAREFLAGVVGPAVGLSAAVSVVSSAVDRLAGMVVLGAVAAVLVVRESGRKVQSTDL